jgi:hypothetical protein
MTTMGPTPRPRLLVCYLCGREYGSKVRPYPPPAAFPLPRPHKHKHKHPDDESKSQKLVLSLYNQPYADARALLLPPPPSLPPSSV